MTTNPIRIPGRGLWVTGLAALLLLGWTPSVADVAGTVVRRVSMASSGSQGNGISPSAIADGTARDESPRLSDTGRFVVFSSDASDLVAGDVNGHADVFLHDNVAKTTTRASLGSAGVAPNGDSFSPAISGDGRYVAFISRATNLDPADANTTPDVYLRDLVANSTLLVSRAVGGAGAQTDGPSFDPVLNTDGTFVGFRSEATNIVAGDTNGFADIFRWNRLSGTVDRRVSVSETGAQANEASNRFSMSGDGSQFAFGTRASNLTTEDKNGATADVVVKDLTTGVVALVDKAASGVQAENGFKPAISKDGKFIAFTSTDSALVSNDTNGRKDVFVHNRATGTTTRVSTATGGRQANGDSDSIEPSISADGRFVAFQSLANNITPDDTNGVSDVFVHDRSTGTSVRVNPAVNGGYGNGPTQNIVISADASTVAFASQASNLVSDDTNGVDDVFVSTVPIAGAGYRLVASDGGIFAFGAAPFLGSTGAIRLNQPVVGMATSPSGQGYWLVARDGGIFAFGDSRFFGSTGRIQLNQPVVGMDTTPDGLGYWLVASDGGIFAFGEAKFFGSTGALRLNQPIVGMASTPSGLGYWLVASDGGIFAFGDAKFLGSMGGKRLNQPIVGLAATPSGFGYSLVASDGGIFAFGDARFFGSMGGRRLNQPVVGIAATASGDGYWMVARDGGIFAFGDAAFKGSTGSISLNRPIVGMDSL